MAALRDALDGLPDPVFADGLESGDAYLLVFDLPGATPETVDARIEGQRLRIEARRSKDLPTEFRYLREDRPLFLDVEVPLWAFRDVDPTGIEGTLDRGVLELRLPKRGEEGGTAVPIAAREREDPGGGVSPAPNADAGPGPGSGGRPGSDGGPGSDPNAGA
jgi:HSP20 family molecular chaperone IbpA